MIDVNVEFEKGLAAWTNFRPLHSFIVDDLHFTLTCGACPEQYDVYGDGVQIAYVRLRHGRLHVMIPDYGGEIVFSHTWEDDPLKGGFDDNERTEFFPKITRAIREYYDPKITRSADPENHGKGRQ